MHGQPNGVLALKSLYFAEPHPLRLQDIYQMLGVTRINAAIGLNSLTDPLRLNQF